MDEILEIAIDSTDGVIDCRIEQKNSDDNRLLSVTILYPNMVNGFSRSEVYCHMMRYNPETNAYYFDENEDIHPKIKKLEKKISDEIISYLQKSRNKKK